MVFYRIALAVFWGLSTGQDIVAHIALKPTSSIRLPGKVSIVRVRILRLSRMAVMIPVDRATPIAEAMMALCLMDHFLRHRAQMPM